MPFVNHPDRDFVIAEMHLRRMPPITAPATVYQTLKIVSSEERADELSHVALAPFTPINRRSSERHCEARNGDGAILLWERHSEATTATIIAPNATANSGSFDTPDMRFTGWLAQAPGQVMRAVQIAVVADEMIAAEWLANHPFDDGELLSCYVAGGARCWSDFSVHSDGYGRLLVAANDMHPADLGRMLQRFQELGNYRNLALLGLRVVQKWGGQLNELENELLAITAHMTDDSDPSQLLNQLIALASSVTSIAATTGYRLSATAAYAEIAQQRLHALDARAIDGFQSLDDFIERRLLPGAKTCAAFEGRLERLAERIERATSQLRTRVDLAIQQQNNEMLGSMERNAARQLHLQHVVEGLSVVAVSYYAVGLFGYLAKGTSHWLSLPDSNAAVAVMTLPIVALVWLYLRHRTRTGSVW